MQIKSKYTATIGIIFCALLVAGKISAAPAPKKIYLTFDADMTAHMKKEQDSGAVKRWYDPALIDYLKKNNIPATFFITGMFAEMYPDLMKEIAANPNFSIQNHSYDHPAYEPGCFGLPIVSSDQKKREEIQQTQTIIKKIIGTSPTYFRFPGLCHKPHDDALAAALGLKLAPEGIASGDAYLKNPAAVAANVLRALPKNRVIIFHMGTKLAPAAASAVKLLVPKLKKLGYNFGRL